MTVRLLRRAALSLVTLSLLSACGGGSDSAATDPYAAYGWSGVTALSATDVAVGTGATASSGRRATVTYTGWLYDVRVADRRGPRFDTNVGSAGHSFTLGRTPGDVIPGFEQGVNGMRVGGKRTVTIPANLGYGSVGFGNSIPPNAALVFDIELTAVN